MKVTNNNFSEVLQHIYDSEINIKIGWFWDGGLDYLIGSNSIQHTGKDNVIEGIQMLVDDLIKEYPESGFVKWCELQKES